MQEYVDEYRDNNKTNKYQGLSKDAQGRNLDKQTNEIQRQK